MSLLSLEITDFRCIEHAEMDFDQRCTVFYGENGSGKTSILESIHVLSCGRSFRAARLESLVRAHHQQFVVHGTTGSPDRPLSLGLQSGPGPTHVRVGGKDVRGFEMLASALPTLVIDPNVHQLLEEGPSFRRRFLDWGVFHVEPQFVEAWRRYQKALKQRNAALKAKLSRQIVTSWDDELIRWGSMVSTFRESFMSRLSPLVAEVTGRLLEVEVEIAHRFGWSADKTLETALADSYDRDVRYGITHVGPHRADLMITVDGVPAKDRVSRGQQKLLSAALVLAQLRTREHTETAPAILLLDDPAAELDVDNLGKLMTEISSTPAQLVVTALHPETVNSLPVAKKFHVKQGSVRPVL